MHRATWFLLLSMLLLAGCSKTPKRTDFSVGSRIYSFVCDKTNNNWTIYDSSGSVVDTGIIDANCNSILQIKSTQLQTSAPASDAPQKARDATTSTSVAYLIDVGNYNAIQIFDPATVTFKEVDLPFTQPLSVSARPSGEALTPDGRFLWVVQEPIGTVQAPRVTIMTTAQQAFTSTFDLPADVFPQSIFFSPDGSRAYISNRSGLGSPTTNNSVLVLDTTSKAVVANIPTPLGAGPSAMTPDGLLLYTMANTSGASAFTVIDTTTNTVATSVRNLSGALRLFVNPSGSRLYVVTFRGVAVYDTATNQLVTTITTEGLLSANDTWVDFSPLGETVWIFDGAANTTYQVDARTSQILTTVHRPALQHGFFFVLPN